MRLGSKHMILPDGIAENECFGQIRLQWVYDSGGIANEPEKQTADIGSRRAF